jgi:5-oxoprolinase (ATP-hydrolysing)
MAPWEWIVIHTHGEGGSGKKGEESRAGRKEDPMEEWRQGSVEGKRYTAEANALLVCQS